MEELMVKDDGIGAIAPAASDLQQCCVKTIHVHARHNRMMVCSECKQVIKCFTEEQPLRNYLRFCASRARKVTTGTIDGMQIVAYSSYDSFTR
jgi:hypothetical protein